MRVFVAGASGFIGSALVPELLAAGHEVHHARPLRRLGRHARRRRGAGAPRRPRQPQQLAARRGRLGRVIHLAFGGFADGPAAGQTELHAIETMGDAIAGSGRPCVIVSGLLGLAARGPAAERDTLDPASPVAAARPGATAPR
jgi:nucleoside-diphosphate-sugar epimerase